MAMRTISLRSSNRVQQWAKDVALSGVLCVLVSFEFDEPLIYGFGATEADCWHTVGKLVDGLSVCRRVVGTSELVWRDQQGREVRSQHFRLEVEGM